MSQFIFVLQSLFGKNVLHPFYLESFVLIFFTRPGWWENLSLQRYKHLLTDAGGKNLFHSPMLVGRSLFTAILPFFRFPRNEDSCSEKQYFDVRKGFEKGESLVFYDTSYLVHFLSILFVVQFPRKVHYYLWIFPRWRKKYIFAVSFIHRKLSECHIHNIQ